MYRFKCFGQEVGKDQVGKRKGFLGGGGGRGEGGVEKGEN